MIFNISVSFDVLTNAIYRSLHVFPAGVVEVERTTPTEWTNIYQLYTDGLGEIGKIRVSKIRDGLTELFFDDSGISSSLDYDEFDKARISFFVESEDQSEAIIEIMKGNWEKEKTLKSRREKHFRDIRTRIFHELTQDGILKARGQPGPEAGADGRQVEARKKPKVQPGTLEKIDRLKEIRRDAIKNNRPIPGRIAACHMAGIDPKTARKQEADLWEKWEYWEY